MKCDCGGDLIEGEKLGTYKCVRCKKVKYVNFPKERRYAGVG